MTRVTNQSFRVCKVNLATLKLTTIERVWGQNGFEDAEQVTRLGTDGRWQHESPHKEELELSPMRPAHNAGRSEAIKFLENGRLSAWTYVNMLQ